MSGKRYLPFACVGVGTIAIATAFAPSLGKVITAWFERDEYSHGVLVPMVAVWVLWQQRETLARLPVQGSWRALPLLTAIVVIASMGEVAATAAVVQYACVLMLLLLVHVALGAAWATALRVPILLLALTIPLPGFLYNSLSLMLQLWSSQLGVACLHLLGVSVYLDGNVIDLGELKLQVAEACSGLRYLFPMVSLAALLAYLYDAAAWKRTLLVLLAPPLAVVMNGLRIATIGIGVEHFGTRVAEGALHEAHGWSMFMLSFAFLLCTVYLLERSTGTWRGIRTAIAIPLVPRSATLRPAASEGRWLGNAPGVAAALLLFAIAATATLVPERPEAPHPRLSFTDFPLRFGSWVGAPQRIDEGSLRMLKLSDYLMLDLQRTPTAAPSIPHALELYVAWYDSQRHTQTAHSPRSCLPGGGWDIVDLRPFVVPNIGTVNRMLIAKGDERRLVYYWFHERGTVVTNEYVARWGVFVDSLVRNRTDGALIRVTVPLDNKEHEAAIDAGVRAFLNELRPRLAPYLAD